jgi:hypothetical protein
MKTYEIKKRVPKTYELNIISNVKLPYGVVMELQNHIMAIKVIPFTIDLTKETIAILKHYENMTDKQHLDTTNLKVTGSFHISYDDDENHNDVEIKGEFL